MAIYSRRIRHIRQPEWVIPVNHPWGAPWAEVAKAAFAARREYLKIHGLGEEASIPDDALRIHCGDDEVVISFRDEKIANE